METQEMEKVLMRKKRMGMLLCMILMAAALSACAGKTDDKKQGTKTAGTKKDESKEERTAKGESEKGMTAPDFEVTLLSGKTVKLSDYRGKRVLLNFWATWCPPCVGELPHIEKKYAEYKDKMHFVILSVDDNEQDPARFIQSKGYTFPAAYGDHQALGRAYGIDAIPASYIISADGHIIARIVGSMNESSLDAFLQKAF